ncbi:hypothetical protein BSL78_28441 [Apostichopus japonicus]|uniref:Uncharacterized protein n=1 Tax=Stichopus japonicus TaxID=307972 RepID=A0A2G8JG93_STIJA|nr:hypothetical protein BSL78_28441 [Apostichopus japonicus]
MQKSVGDQKPDAKEDGESAMTESVAKTAEVTEKASKEEQEKQKDEKEIVSSQLADEEKKKEVPAASPKNEEMISPMSPPPEDRDERIKAVVGEKVAEECSGKEDQGGSEKKLQGAEGKELSIKEDSKVARGDVDHRLTKENSDVDERKVEHSRDVDGAKIDVDLRKDKTESKKDVDDRKVSDVADANIQKQHLKIRRGPAAGEDVDERFNSLEEEKEDGKKKATEKDVDDRRIAVGDSEESTKVEVKMTIKDTDERKLDKTDHDAREQTKDDRGKDEKKQISSDPVSSAKDKSTTNIESQKSKRKKRQLRWTSTKETTRQKTQKENEGAEKQPAIPSLMSLSGIAEAHPRFIRSSPDVERRRSGGSSLRSPRNTIGSWKKRNNSAGQGCSRTGRGKCYRRMRMGIEEGSPPLNSRNRWDREVHR